MTAALHPNWPDYGQSGTERLTWRRCPANPTGWYGMCHRGLIPRDDRSNTCSSHRK